MTRVLLSNTWQVLASQGSTGFIYTAGRSSIKIGLLQDDVCCTAEGFSVGYLINLIQNNTKHFSDYKKWLYKKTGGKKTLE